MNGLFDKLKEFTKYHFHIVLYTYFWFGLFVCGLVAPENRISELGSSLITKGRHLSLLSLVLILPVPIIYYMRMRRDTKTENEE